MARPKSDSSKIAFNTIREKINRFELMPGSTVSDLAISQELDMSRTPVREAIFKLVECHLIEREKNRFVVCPIEIEDIREILQTREAIECMAVRSIIAGGGPPERSLQELRMFASDMEACLAARHLATYFQRDGQFHVKLVELAGNVRMTDVASQMQLQGERLRCLSVLTHDRCVAILREHGQILSALEEMDLPVAEQAIRLHLTNTLRNYQYILAGKTWVDMLATLQGTFS
ncbi:MAG: GntR family transcriptional regulator [Spirochaetia bacterium]|jgi:DNA-binding GntR family transcriptional regulator|nr:GntR family transcriptional regulator [Spirochaetia bacterium]